MKKYIIALVLFAGIVSAFAFTSFKKNIKSGDEKGITFIEQDWAKATEQAKAQNKLIFLDIYASWCGPCKMLKKNTFSDEKVGSFFNEHFINVSVDGEKGVGPQLAQQYGIQAYPSLIVTDASGKPVLYTMGYMEASDLMSFAKAALAKKQ
jgi:thiol:disulfide interchange protein